MHGETLRLNCDFARLGISLRYTFMQLRKQLLFFTSIRQAKQPEK